jgi:hypothetical protein
MSTIVDGQTGITFNDSSNQQTAGYTGFRNRIINGAMVIDQRNAGAVITPTNGQYSVDRWACYLSQASKYTVQQNAGSVTPPVGFSNYLGVTSSSTYVLLSTDLFFLFQAVEGFNTYDLAFGTANAKSITLSFWAYSSLTGIFGGTITNGAYSRSYGFTYSISSANTWTYITIIVPGDTSGSWIGATNGVGLYLRIGLGCGTSGSLSAGSWQPGGYSSVTGAVSVVSTNGATFYLTGVQIEKAGTATPFEFRQYGTEFALCQRYLYKLFCDSSTGNTFFMPGTFTAATGGLVGTNFPQRMRAVPTLYQEGVVSNFALYAANGGAYSALTTLSLNGVTSTTFGLLNIGIASGGTAGQGAWLAANTQTLYGLGFLAEL